MENRRKDLRLKGYDYAQEGAYFITLCTWGRECLFGDIVNDDMQLNEIGSMVHREWMRTAIIRPNVTLDLFMIMPNHIHGIIILNVGATRRVAPTPNGPKPGSVGAIVGQFKSLSTKHIRAMWPNKQIWQRNYYEHVIRDDMDLNRVREYIINNPKQWTMDEENPNKNYKA